MSRQAGFGLRGRNPDVLSCIANLSNDEVFTPPELANRMLDTLAEAWAQSHGGASIWADPDIRFLDPCTKSGVFLREITSRLNRGLAEQMPDVQKRVEHILTKQVFGIAITRITALLARRSLYCSKFANGKHSIVQSMMSESGHVWFERTEHSWVKGRCAHCGASVKTLDRGGEVETHAYAFIHADDIKAKLAEMFGGQMQFDVIVGNPPYQLDDGGAGASAVPIYDKFIEQAKQLQPRLLTMVIPARWYFGGRRLDGFREGMLKDSRLRKVIDYPDSRQVFNGVDVAGGVCYFLWNSEERGGCEVTSFRVPEAPTVVVRPLLEDGADVFIRNNESISILKKVMKVESGAEVLRLPEGRRFDQQVSTQKPFGLRTFFRGNSSRVLDSDVIVRQAGGQAYAPRESIEVGRELIDKWKVFTSKSSAEHAGQVDRSGMRRVLSFSGILPPGSVVTETYILLGSFDSQIEARNCMSYVCTKFFRFLIASRSSAQDLPRSAYAFVPSQDYKRKWCDADLYEKYGLSDADIQFIEATIKPMELEADG